MLSKEVYVTASGEREVATFAGGIKLFYFFVFTAIYHILQGAFGVSNWPL